MVRWSILAATSTLVADRWSRPGTSAENVRGVLIEVEQRRRLRDDAQSMKRYFKKRTDSAPQLDLGAAYFEFDDDLPLRQVEQYGDRWYDSRSEYHADPGPGPLVDQPPDVLGLDANDEIAAAEFEEAWTASTTERS